MGCTLPAFGPTFDCFFLYRDSGKKRVDASRSLTLDSIRLALIRQEDSIIFSLLERAQFSYNADTYDHDAFSMDGFNGSLVEYMVLETERLHAQVISFFISEAVKICNRKDS